MGVLAQLFRSSVGKKYVMAVTGLLLFGFVIVHLIGNLQIFIPDGGDALNAYGHVLKNQPAFLWAARLGLLALAVLHVVMAIQLALANRRARPVAYAKKDPAGASVASRTIVWSGLIILAFVLFHLAHYTLFFVDPNYGILKDAQGRHDVYTMSIRGFSNPAVSAFYVVAMGLLCLHLSHGVGSMFQSLGLRNKRFLAAVDRFAKISALVIFLGNSAIPIAVLTGLIGRR